MESFRYRAIDGAGRIRTGRLPAPTAEALEARLRGEGLDLLAWRREAPGLVGLARPIGRRELIHLCFQLEQLLRAGVPLLQGLRDIALTGGDPRLRDALLGVARQIDEGKSFSAALEATPRLFRPPFTPLVRIGEQSGRLPEVLHDFSETLKWQEELAARLRAALTYPAVAGLVIGAALLFLMIYLVPRLVQFIGAFGATLPVQTRALLLASRFVADYWPLLILAPPAAAAVLALALRHHGPFRLRFDGLVLRLWLLGDLLRKAALARFTRLFALMYSAGLPVMQALQLAGETTGNRFLAAAFEEVRAAVGSGETLHAAFERTALFPPLLLRMIHLGESTGGLDGALRNVGDFYEREVRERIGRLEALVEPLFTLILGALLGWVMLAVLGPLYDLLGTLRE